MQIKLVSKGLVELSDNGNLALVAFPEAKIPDSDTLVFGQQQTENVVTRPGEYEFANVGLVALETKAAHNGTAELFDVELGGVNTLFVMSDFGALSKEDWDQLDSVQIMVVSLKDKPEGLEKLINRLSPYVVIGIDAESDAEAEKLTGLLPMPNENRFKFSEKDFEAEDPAPILHLMK